MALGFRHKTPIQIRFVDIDKFGHVNNANHLSYLELARTHYFDAVIGPEINWDEEGVILAKIIIEYKIPILLQDKIWVYTKCSRIGNKSFDLSYIMVKEQDGKEVELASGSTVMVSFNYLKQKTIAVPEKWKMKLTAYDTVVNS